MSVPQRSPRAEEASAAEIFAMVQTIARSFKDAPLETLVQVHAMVRDRLMDLIDHTPPGDFSNATEQRVLGTMWAECEEAIDARAPKYTHGPTPTK